ncbi:MAG: T9SS type A sorting domain-containing protein, partial [Bacteroidia bacterium]
IGADTAFCATVNPHVLTAQTSALIYLWSTGATSQSISVSSGGTYSVDVTDSNGCIGSDTSTITIYPTPIISFVPAQDSFCLSNGPFALTATPAGGTFSGPGVSGNTFSPTVAGIGVHTLTYAYTDSLGCSATSSPVIMTVDVCTGLNAATAQTIFTATPNPSNGLFAVNVSLPGTLVIYTIEGREVYRAQHNAAGRSDVDLSAFGSGMYLLRYVYEGGQSAARVSVQ